jgi:hypothetical protein
MAGLIMMTIMASIFYFLGKASANGTLQMKNAVGGIGEVYLTIKGKRGGIGKVQITVQGSLRTLDAMTDDDVDIPTGNVITVTQVLNETILLVTAK